MTFRESTKSFVDNWDLIRKRMGECYLGRKEMNCTQAMEEYARNRPLTRLDISHASAGCIGDVTDMANTYMLVCFEHNDRIEITCLEVHEEGQTAGNLRALEFGI